jgi:2-polyprenyl-6-methoxyphenol hydroxylase-like FAD-dependent oxidoreductase
VGDAGYYRDPLLGQGINDALRDAEALAGALDPVLNGRAAWDDVMAGYQRQRDEATGDIYHLTAMLTEKLDPGPAEMAILAGGPPAKSPATA